MLRIVTPPQPVVSLADAKAHLRVDWTEDDATITSLLAVATEDVEAEIQQALGTQTWDLVLENNGCTYHHEPITSPYWRTNGPWGWRGYGAAFVLPLRPLISVTSIKYLDQAGTEQTFSSGDYIVSGVGGEGRITVKSTATWPTIGAFPEALTIRFIAGFDTIPARAKQAILMRTAQLFATRGEMVDIRVAIDLTTKHLLAGLRVFA